MATVDTLLVRIEADLKDVNRKLQQFDRRVDDTQKKAGRGFNKIAGFAKLALGAVVVQQFAQAGLAAVRFASGVEEMRAKSSVVFGQFAGEVRDALGQFGDEVGRSTFELEGMASSIQDTFVPMGFARGEAAKLSVELTKLAVDVASFNNASDTETMAAFQSALVGNHETVRRFGIVITEATLQQELYRMGVKENAQDVDNATKVQARMNLILAGTTDAHGDAARTSDSFANSSKALNAALEELMVAVVMPLLPALTDMVQGFTDATTSTQEFLTFLGLIGDGADTAAGRLKLVSELTAEIADAEVKLRKLEQDALDQDIDTTLQDVIGVIFPKLATGAEKSANAIVGGNKRIDDSISSLRESIANLKKERDELNQIDVNQRILDDQSRMQQGQLGATTDDTKTKGQIKAEEKITQALKDQANANALLRLEQQGVNQSFIEATAEAQKLKGITQEQFEALVALKEEEEVLNLMLEANAEAAKKDAEAQALRMEQIQKVEDTIKSLTDQNKLLDLENENLTASEMEFQKLLMTLGDEVSPAYKAELQALIEQKHAHTAATEAAAAEEEKFNASVSNGVSFVNSLKTEEEKLNEVMADLGNAYAEGSINQDQFNQGMAAVQQSMQELDPIFQQVRKGAEQAADSIAGSLADGLMEGKLSLDGFQDIFKTFVRDLIKEAIKTFIIKQIFGSFMGGGMFGFGGGGSVGGTNMGNTLLSHAGGGAIRARASGGPVLVGERGPELFIPNSAGVIRNNHDTMNMMGGGQQPVVNQTINITTGVAQTVRAEVMSMMPRIKSETISAMIDGKKRGNAVSKAFG